MQTKKKAKRRITKVARGTKPANPHAVPNNIKAWRSRRQYSQEELALMCGVSRVTVSNWENCIKSPSDKHKMMLCKALECSIYELFNWEV